MVLIMLLGQKRTDMNTTLTH